MILVSLADMVLGYCTLSDINKCMDQFFMEADVDQNTIAKLGTIDHINSPILKRRCRWVTSINKFHNALSRLWSTMIIVGWTRNDNQRDTKAKFIKTWTPYDGNTVFHEH